MRQNLKIIKWDFREIWKALIIIISVIPALSILGVIILKAVDWGRGAHILYLIFEIAVQCAVIGGIMLVIVSVMMKYFSARSLFDFANISGVRIILVRILEVFAVTLIFTLMGMLAMTLIDSCYAVDYAVIRNGSDPKFLALSAVGKGWAYWLLPIGSGMFSLLVSGNLYLAGRVFSRFKSREIGTFVCIFVLVVSVAADFLSISYFDHFFGLDLNIFQYDFLFPQSLLYNLVENRTNMQSMLWFTSFTNVVGLPVKLIIIFANISIGLALETLKTRGGQNYGY